MIIDGWASLFNVKDSVGDIVRPGAYTETLAEWREGRRGIGMHLDHTSACIIGVWTDLEERDAGLWVRGRLIHEVRDGAEAAVLVRERALRGMSIGYSATDSRSGPEGRELLTISLREISLVTSPCCLGCMIEIGDA